MSYGDDLASLKQRAKLSRGLLLSLMGLIVAAFPLGFAVAAGLLGPNPLRVLRGVLVVYSFVWWMLLAVCAAMVMAWTHRAWTNLSEMRLSGLRHTPAWAAASFVVPVAGLFVPFVAMRELYNRSLGEDEYQAHASVGDVTSWWACYLGAVFVLGFLGFAAVFNSYGVVFISALPIVWTLTRLLSVVLQLAACFFLWRIVGTITRAQESFTGIAEAFA